MGRRTSEIEDYKRMRLLAWGFDMERPIHAEEKGGGVTYSQRKLKGATE